MGYEQTGVNIDSDKKKIIAPMLERYGMTFSSFVRKSMDDFIESHQAIEAGKTQIDARLLHRGDAA